MTHTEWIGGRLSAPMYITDGEPYRPDLVIWFEATTQLIVGSTVVHPSESAAAVTTCLRQALRKPMMGPRRCPQRIRVAEPELIDAVRHVVGPSVAIEAAPTPELDAIVKLMMTDLSTGDEETASYFEAGRISAQAVSRLFNAAARLYRAAPWKVLWDSQLLGIDIPALGIAGHAASVIGALGESFGVLIHDSVQGHLAMRAVADVIDETGETPESLGTHILSLNFDPADCIPPLMRGEIRQHGWEVAGPQAYPRVLSIEPDRLLRPLTERDIRVVIAVADALAGFCTKHRRDLGTEPPEPITEDMDVDLGDDRVAVRVTAPHPDLPWEDDEQTDEEETDADVSSLIDAFLEARVSSGTAVPEEWVQSAGFVCEALLRYKLDYAGGDVEDLTAGDVEEFLLDHFPRKLTAEEETIQRTPEVLRAFVTWLRQAGVLSAQVANAAVRRITASEARFYQYAADRSRFGLAKSLATMMHERGIDITDDEQVRGFIAEYNPTLNTVRAAPGTWPPPEPNGPAAHRPVKQRWTPAPGGSVPDATSPCPCGSGRRYKKCCMRR